MCMRAIIGVMSDNWFASRLTCSAHGMEFQNGTAATSTFYDASNSACANQVAGQQPVAQRRQGQNLGGNWLLTLIMP